MSIVFIKFFKNFLKVNKRIDRTFVKGYKEVFKKNCFSEFTSLNSHYIDTFTYYKTKKKVMYFFMNPIETDYGNEPFVFNIDLATELNNNFRTAIWTGEHLQLTLMSIKVGGEIGLEKHDNLDQFIRIEEGNGLVMMGANKDKLNYQRNVNGNFAILIPAGTWHNLYNIGNKPLKLYSIYAPPQHPFGTIHKTKEDADKAELEKTE